jgi:hypothetical protein
MLAIAARVGLFFRTFGAVVVLIEFSFVAA